MLVGFQELNAVWGRISRCPMYSEVHYRLSSFGEGGVCLKCTVLNSCSRVCLIRTVHDALF